VIRRHYFLFAALAAVVLMIGVVTVKLLTHRPTGGAGGGGAVATASGAGAQGGGAAGGTRRTGAAGGRGAGGGQQIEVTVAPVKLQSFADHIEVLGVAKGRQSVSITSKNAELITAVRFHDGDHVRANQVLVDLQGTEQDAAIDQAQSVADLAKLNADRWTTLEQKGIAARSQADQYRAVYAQARAALAAAKSRRLDRVIRAPFAGVVGLSDVAPGALISPGAVIATLDDVTVIRADFDVPDRYLSTLKDGTPIVATTDSYPDEQFTGVIAKLDSRINERTRTIKVRAELRNPDGRIKPGALMRIGIQSGVRQALVAPESGVQFNDTQSYVFVVTRNDQGRSISTKTPVVVGARDAGFIEIKIGLKPGDMLVQDGINRLQPVAPVRVVGGAGQGRRGPGGSSPAGGVAVGGQGQGGYRQVGRQGADDGGGGGFSKGGAQGDAGASGGGFGRGGGQGGPGAEGRGSGFRSGGAGGGQYGSGQGGRRPAAELTP
jgi:membrane fusion protein (multidrug efflux system)